MFFLRSVPSCVHILFQSLDMFVLVSNKWSNFLHENLVDLRNEGILCDVTLSGSDGQIQLAHSSILAAASTVFKSCLVQAPRFVKD